MNNQELKSLIEAIESGGKTLSMPEQAQLARKLLRANHRVQAARRAGFVEEIEKAKPKDDGLAIETIVYQTTASPARGNKS